VEYVHPYVEKGEEVAIVCGKDGSFGKYRFGEILDGCV
jgi:hypothetical protein